MRILVCGSRDWPGTWEDIGRHLPDDDEPVLHMIIHGAYSHKVPREFDDRGVRRTVMVETSVDMLADFVARGLGHNVEKYPVDHAIDGPWPGAGPRRNARMLRDGQPHRGIAFGALWRRNDEPRTNTTWVWKRTGTGGMVKLMIDAGLPVRWVATPNAAAVNLTKMPEPPR